MIDGEINSSDRDGRRNGLGHPRTVRPRNRRDDRGRARKPRARAPALPAGRESVGGSGRGVRHDRDGHRRVDDLRADDWPDAKPGSDRQLGSLAMGHARSGHQRGNLDWLRRVVSRNGPRRTTLFRPRRVPADARHVRALRRWLVDAESAIRSRQQNPATRVFLGVMALAAGGRRRASTASGGMGWVALRSYRCLGLGGVGAR